MQLFNKISFQTGVQIIRKGSVTTVKTGRTGKSVTCLEGTLWITQEGDGLDRILTSGDMFQSRIPGDIIIEGLVHSQVRISPLQKAGAVKTFQTGIQTQPACA